MPSRPCPLCRGTLTGNGLGSRDLLRVGLVHGRVVYREPTPPLQREGQGKCQVRFALPLPQEADANWRVAYDKAGA